MAGKKIPQLQSLAVPSLSGLTIVEQSGVTYYTTLQALRTTLVDNGSHTITGSLTANSFIGNGSQLTNLSLPLLVSNSAFNTYTSSVSNFSASFDQRIKNATNEQILDGFAITGSNNFKGNQTISGSLIIGGGGLEPGNPEALKVRNSGSINVARFYGNQEAYAQINLKNFNNGNNASADIVVTADNGNESIHFIDMGINSSTYNGGYVGYENDAYLLNVGNDLYVGTVGGISHPSNLNLFAQNNWVNPQIIISGSKQISFNTGSVSDGFQYEFSGSIKSDHDLSVIGTVYTNNIHNNNEDINILASNFNNIGLWAEGGTVSVTGSLFVNSSISTYADVTGNNFITNGVLFMGGASEKITPYDSYESVSHSFASSAILYLTGLSNDVGLNIFDVPSDDNKALGFTVMIEQGSTPYTINDIHINDDYEGSVSIQWHGGSQPTVNANSTDIISFSLIKINNTWRVLGQLTTF